MVSDGLVMVSGDQGDGLRLSVMVSAHTKPYSLVWLCVVAFGHQVCEVGPTLNTTVGEPTPCAQPWLGDGRVVTVGDGHS